MDVKPDTWEERLILFVGYLADKELQSTTIRCYISAIKAVLQEDSESLNEDVYLLKALTRACKLHQDRVKTRLPIRKTLLFILSQELENIYQSQPYLLCLFKAIFTTMYFSMFRIGEVTESNHVLRARDVKMGTNKHKIMFMLRSSKTHSLGSCPQIIKISSIEYDPLGNKLQQSQVDVNPTNDKQLLDNLCPFSIIASYIQVRKVQKWKDDTEQFFTFSDRTPVQASHVRRILKELLTNCGLDSGLYGTHSARAGHSVDLYHLGVSLPVICKLGWWCSSAVYNYLKP